MSSTNSTQRGTVTQTAAPSTCTWLGHCLGDSCTGETECDRDWECHSEICVQACTWPDHCLGDQCQSYNDCDHNWICNEGRCIVCEGCDSATASATSATSQSVGSISQTSSTTPSPTAADNDGISTGAVIGISVAVPVCVIAIALIALLIWWRRRKRRRVLEERAEVAGSGRCGSGPSREMKKVIELDTDRVPAELDENDGTKHLYQVPTIEVQSEPVEIDGRERKSHYRHGDEDYWALHRTMDAGSTDSIPSQPPKSTTPAIGYAFSTRSERELSSSPDIESGNRHIDVEVTQRRKLQRKRGHEAGAFF